MTEEKYFIIHNSEGDTSIDCLTKEDILRRIKENYYGNNLEYLECMPMETNTNYWNNKFLVIKGNIVVPKQVKVAIEYDID